MPATQIYLTLWRHKVMIVVLTAIAAVAAYAFTRTQPRIYEATALVRIQQRADSAAEAYGALGSLEVGQRLAQTYARIVETRSMHDRVARKLGRRIPSDDISISAAPEGDVELLTISARSERPATAALVANATASALGDFIDETGTLRDQIVVVDRATRPVEPVLPRTAFIVAIAILFAFMLNGALALAREFFTDRLPAIDSWEEKFGRPVLANVPTLQLKGASAAVSARPEQDEPSGPTVSTEALTGPTRWSTGVPETRSRAV